MTRFFLFLIGFMIGFTLEVRVEANERVQLIPIDLKKEKDNKLSSALLQEPRECLDSKKTCALRVGARRLFVYEPTAGRQWTAGENTIVLRLDDCAHDSSCRMRFIEGVVRITGEETLVETDLGDLKARGEVFIERHGSKLLVVNTGDQPLLFKGRGWVNERAIPSGVEVTLDLPNVKNGKTSVNLPLPLDFEKQVVREARFYTGKRADFPAHLEEIAKRRIEAAGEIAALHQEVVERKIASIDEAAKAVQAKRAEREARDRELRALFRRKVLNPD